MDAATEDTRQEDRQDTPEPAGASQPDSPRQPGTRRPGGRTARTRAAVLEAALAELVESGYTDVRIEQIAARAGVAPSTVYRRWGDLEGIVQDLSSELSVSIDLQDHGDLELDLRQVARAVVALRGIPAHRAWLDLMVTAAVRSPNARQTLAAAIERRRDITMPVVERAIARGEVPDDTDAHEVIRIALAPLYLRMYVSGEEIDDEIADRSAAVAALAARQGLLRKESRS